MDKSKVRKALEDSPEPTPGYLYNEFAQWTWKDLNSQTDLVNYLFDRLQRSHTSAFVLYKALHIVKLLCEMAHPDFQREVQRTPRAEVIRQLTTYRGVMDAKYGDAWNEKVRQEAREALVSVFTEFPSRQQQQQQQHTSSSSWQGSGFGSSADAPFSSTSSATFRTGLATSTMGGGNNMGNSSNSVGLGGVSTYAGMESHIGEMPKENKWAEHMARMQSDPEYARRARLEREGGGGGGSTFLSHLTRTAKAGWQSVAQHEALLLNANVPSVRAGASSYESSYTRGLALSDDVQASHVRSSGFQPVALSSPPFDDTTSASRGGSAAPAAATNEFDLSSRGLPMRWRAASTDVPESRAATTTITSSTTAAAGARGQSQFAFLNCSATAPQDITAETLAQARVSPSPSPASSPHEDTDDANPLVTAVESWVQAYVVSPQHTLPRVELADGIARAVQLAARAEQCTTTTRSQRGQPDPFEVVFGAGGDAAPSPSSARLDPATDGGGVDVFWSALAHAFYTHLDPLKQTWRVRLNVLVCVEGLLKASPASIAALIGTSEDKECEEVENNTGLSHALDTTQVTRVLSRAQAILTDVFTCDDTDNRVSGAARLRENASVVQATLKEKAMKVLALLGLSVVPPPRPVQAQPAKPVAAEHIAPASAASLDNLFGNDDPTASASAGGLFDGVSMVRRRAGKSATTTTTKRASPEPSSPCHGTSPNEGQDTQGGIGDTALGRPRRLQRAQPAAALNDTAAATTASTRISTHDSHFDDLFRAAPVISRDDTRRDEASVVAPLAPPPASALDLAEQKEAQLGLEGFLDNLLRRQAQGGAAAPSASELAHAQQLVQQQRQQLFMLDSSPARATFAQDNLASLFEAPGLSSTHGAAWAMPQAVQQAEDDAQQMEKVLTGSGAVDGGVAEQTHFQMGQASTKLSRVQVANKELAAVQAEMLSKYAE